MTFDLAPAKSCFRAWTTGQLLVLPQAPVVNRLDESTTIQLLL